MIQNEVGICTMSVSTILKCVHDESIGESMQLNAAYKPPAGYKPVYKEAKLFIPVSTIAYDTHYVFLSYHKVSNAHMYTTMYYAKCL